MIAERMDFGFCSLAAPGRRFFRHAANMGWRADSEKGGARDQAACRKRRAKIGFDGRRQAVGRKGGFLSDSDAPENAEIEAELQRILLTPEFLKNSGASGFLKFVVEESLAGRGDRLKAFTIATMVFERDSSFDAQSNSAVRVQALRLRNLLQAYYAGAGQKNPVRIVLRTGSYRPAFVRVGAAAATEAEASAAEIPAKKPDRAARRIPKAALAALGLVACALALWLFVRPASPPSSEAADAPGVPILVVERPEKPGEGAAGAFAGHLLDRVELELSAYDNLTVEKPGGNPSRAYYALTLRQIPSENGLVDFAFELLRQPEGVIVWSKNFARTDVSDPAQLAGISDRLVQTVGDAYGVVDLDAIRHLQDFDGVPRGFNCTLCAFAFMRSQTIDRLRVARDCLELAVKTNPRDDGAKALLAILLVHFHIYGLPESAGEEDLARAMRLAQEAYNLAPGRARSHFALFVTRFYARKFADGFAAAQQTLEINPLSALYNRAIGSARIARADYDLGLTLLGGVRDDPSDSSAAVGSVALAAFMRDDLTAASDLLGRPGAGDGALGLTLQIALCARNHDVACARANGEKLRLNFPGLARDMDAGFDRAAFADPIRRHLLDELRTAGFFTGGGE